MKNESADGARTSGRAAEAVPAARRRVRPDATRAVYAISVAAELVGCGPQNLRAYEAYGLLQPQRSSGGTRRYSQRDLDRLREILDLLAAGLNLAGIAHVLHLRADNAALRAELARLRS